MYIALKIILLLVISGNFILLYSIIGMFAILPSLFFCGLIDVSRHKTMNLKLLKEYFFGKGVLTFLISPLNLFVDLISHRNIHSFRIEDFPKEFQTEIKIILKLFDKNKVKIENRFKKTDDNRTMLFYKWYGKNLDESINDFTKDFDNIKTIGVSLFREKTSTSRHFGPLRLTYRLLYNFNKVKNNGSYIEADGTINVWKNNPLFIFDDTLIHQSFNDEDDIRFCAFIDVIRPTYFRNINILLLKCVGFVLKKYRGIFYKNWKMI